MSTKTTAELIQEYPVSVKGPDGASYTPRAYAEERRDGTWAGWLEFYPLDDQRPTLRTDQETSQSNRRAIQYWATSLEPAYFDVALLRALERAHDGHSFRKAAQKTAMNEQIDEASRES